MTTIRELIEQLEELAEDYGDETRIVGAFQPSYPLAAEIGTPVVIDPAQPDDDEELIDDELAAERDANGPPIAWLPLLGHPYDLNPYAPQAAFSAGY